jgi:hypothetical protein
LPANRKSPFPPLTEEAETKPTRSKARRFTPQHMGLSAGFSILSPKKHHHRGHGDRNEETAFTSMTTEGTEIKTRSLRKR